ncbi:MAG: hypothetical protein JST86_11535 [Bacteroidetes bacterium]|nr:hypothetical protein [Bacteroidota bacterium]
MRLLAIILFLSFSAIAKADTVDNYQIYIKKVLVRNESGFPSNVKNKSFIKIDKALCNETLELHFHHCTGYEGKRKVVIADKSSGVLKEFEFTTSDYDAAMLIPISILCESSWIKSGVTYSLIYFDTMIDKGRHLTDIQVIK